MMSLRSIFMAAMVVAMLMADMANAQGPTGTRRRDFDHIGQFNFIIEIDGLTAGSFMSVDGLSVEQEIIEFNDTAPGEKKITPVTPPTALSGTADKQAGNGPDSRDYDFSFTFGEGISLAMMDTWANELPISAASAVISGHPFVANAPLPFLQSLGDMENEEVTWTLTDQILFTPVGEPGSLVLLRDGTSITTHPIPEPGTLILLALGTIYILCCKRCWPRPR